MGEVDERGGDTVAARSTSGAALPVGLRSREVSRHFGWGTGGELDAGLGRLSFDARIARIPIRPLVADNLHPPMAVGRRAHLQLQTTGQTQLSLSGSTGCAQWDLLGRGGGRRLRRSLTQAGTPTVQSRRPLDICAESTLKHRALAADVKCWCGRLMVSIAVFRFSWTSLKTRATGSASEVRAARNGAIA